uniref:Peptidyl-prolyl cis-trans isomerase n=1 Tax=Haptolina brevifila TaxID=156173 RepID=A0A7S2DKH9_9EUKA
MQVVVDPSKPEDVEEIALTVHKEWAPLGAQRFLDLIDAKYYDDCRIYRVIPGFICQWGIPADPAQYSKWGDNKIKDDPVKISNTAGKMSFATSGPDARGSQVFINYDDSCAQLDSQGFSPFAEVTRGMDVAKKLYEEKGKVDQAEAKVEGNKYFKKWPNLSYIKSAKRA